MSAPSVPATGRGRDHLRRPQSSGLERWLEIVAMLLRLLLWPARQFTTLLSPSGEFDGLSPAVAAKAAQHFINYLKTIAPQGVQPTEAWSSLGFVAAKEEASNTGSLLLLYLHSPLHRCAVSHAKLLCHDSVMALLMQPNVLALGLSIHSGQGAQLAQMLSVKAYPALCLMEPPPRDASSSNNRKLTLLFQAEGSSLLAYSAEQLVPLLQSSVQRHQTILAEQEARRIEREQETLLRQQQDAEYQAALQADQERERQQAEAAAEEDRLRREEEERVAEDERQARAVIDTARGKLREAPSSGGAMIRFVLPSGQKVNRRFYGDDTIGACRAFVRLHCHENDIEMGTIGLSTNFPKKSYNDDDTITLEDAGLRPQAVLMVQDLDI